MRSQVGPFDEDSLRAGLLFEDSPFAARQEFAQESDINFLMRRSGVPFSNAPLVYGEHDFDVDLQRAYTVTQEAREAFRRLEPVVQAKYGSWENLYLQTLEEANKPRESPPVVIVGD